MRNFASTSSSRSARPTKVIALCAAAALFALAASSASAAPILVNGSLEGPTGTNSVPAGWTITAPTPDTNSQTSNNAGGVGPGLVYQNRVTASDSPDGGTWVALAGGPTVVTEKFHQLVSGFTLGNSYTLSWYHANFGLNFLYNGNTLVTNEGSAAIEVFADGTSIGSGAVRDMSTGWVDESITFIAGATAIDFTFSSLDYSGVGAGPSYQSIDGIRLTENTVVPPIDPNPPSNAVPEPAALSLFSGAGLAMLLASRRRKKEKQAAA